MAKILIAEDERDIRELIQFTLTYAGHEVTAVANGEDAVKQAEVVLPDLILLDMRMPKMTGLEAIAALRASASPAKDTPVVFLSAKGIDEEHQQGVEVGAIDFIMKPFAPDDLNRRIGEILQKIGAAS